MSPQSKPICRVLYVEDTPEDQRLLGEAVSLSGVEVHITSVATAAVALQAIAERHEFDVLLLDWNLPAVTGLEFLASVRSRQPDLPVLILTGEPGTVDLPNAARFGADTVIRKPYTLEDWESLAVRLYGFCAETRAVSGRA